jgi:hypothetical protein
LIFDVDLAFFIEEPVIKEEPMTPMSTSSIGEGVSTEVKPPIPEPIQSTAVGDKKRKCCKCGEISIKQSWSEILNHNVWIVFA